jgi:hypothetical protein
MQRGLIHIAKVYCQYSDCEKADRCKRFIDKGDTEIMFQYICPTQNYRWFQQAEQSIVKQE